MDHVGGVGKWVWKRLLALFVVSPKVASCGANVGNGYVAHCFLFATIGVGAKAVKRDGVFSADKCKTDAQTSRHVWQKIGVQCFWIVVF